MSNYPQEGQFKCNQCGAIFQTREQLVAHQLTHQNMPAEEHIDTGTQQAWRGPQYEHASVHSGSAVMPHSEHSVGHEPASMPTEKPAAHLSGFEEEHSRQGQEREHMQPGAIGSGNGSAGSEAKGESLDRSNATKERSGSGSKRTRKSKPKK